MSKTTAVYVFFSEVKLTKGSRLTGLTWIMEELGTDTRIGHHYFIDYPGARDLERQTAEVVGGKPLTRYSPSTVMLALSNDLPPRSVLVLEDLLAKEKFKDYLEAMRVTVAAPMTVMGDAVLLEEDRLELEDLVAQIRVDAASRFGSSL